jgi:CMP-N-acetylneuraminic acid synthetase
MEDRLTGNDAGQGVGRGMGQGMGRGVVALLPMKAHSERVSGKNFREFCGKPLYRWILDTLLEVEAISRVVINTDAREILLENGLGEIMQRDSRVVIRDRREDLCGDFVSMNLILEDDIEAVPGDLYLMTHTTNPLLGSQTIQAALAAFDAGRKDGSADSLFAVNRHQTRFYREDASPVNHDPANLIRTQDLECWYEENSNLYLFTGESFAATRARIGAAPLLFETPIEESVDIDDARTWRLAELIARGLTSAAVARAEAS